MNLLTAYELDQGFYVRRSYTEVLRLEALERDVYAIIRAFTESGEFGAYIGNHHYISAMTGKAKSSVNKALHSLAARGLILKKSVNTGTAIREGYAANLKYAEVLVNEYLKAAGSAVGTDCESAEGGNTAVDGARGERGDDRQAENVCRGASAKAPSGARENALTADKTEAEAAQAADGKAAETQEKREKPRPCSTTRYERADTQNSAAASVGSGVAHGAKDGDVPRQAHASKENRGAKPSQALTERAVKSDEPKKDGDNGIYKRASNGEFTGYHPTAEYARSAFERALMRTYEE